MYKKSQKAAMFGLDARIALAIFGALSVITGAALYKTIQHARVISFINQIEEVSKAIDSYRLDTASLPATEGVPSAGGFFSISGKTVELIENSRNLSGWRGPYIDLGKANAISLEVKDHLIYISARADRTPGSKISSEKECHKTKDDCSLRIGFSYQGEDKASIVNLFNAVEEYIDGPISDTSFRTGKIRFLQSGTASNYYLDSTESSSSPKLLYLVGPYPRNHLR